jgi:hypothetical protein
MEQNSSPLSDVFTASVASEKWGVAEDTVRKWCQRKKFKDGEARKDKGTWLVTRSFMVRMTGRDIE